MKPEVKVFTRENPCTKLDIWNCFRARTGFVKVPVVEAQAQIGANVPRVMEREGRLEKAEARGVEYYVLTAEGEEWLSTGFARYLKNHPSHAPQAKFLPSGSSSSRLRRTR